MPTLLTDVPEVTTAAVPHRKRWTREQCALLEAAGVFDRERLELVDGDLVSKMGKNRPHVNAVMLILVWLQKTFGDAFVDTESPIDVNPAENVCSEPEPDLIVRKQERSLFVSGNPQPGDIRLLVEVSDSTLHYDLNVKGPLYARAGVAEYWVLDVTGRELVVHRGPINGRYQSIVRYSELEAIAPLAAPEAMFLPANAFPVKSESMQSAASSG